MKKTHILRKAAALLLAGAMLTGTVSAERAETTVASGEVGALRHVMENIREYLYMFDYDMTDISISGVYPVYTFGEADTDINFYTCYAIKDGKIIGDFAISESGGKYNSTFGLRESPEIDEMLENNLPVSFAADGNNLYMVGGETACVVSSEINQEGTVYSASELNIPQLEQRAMCASEVPQVYSVQDASDIIAKRTYKVPKVKNVTIDGEGQCWAACVASKVMYEVDKYKNANLTAEIVHDAVKDSNGSIPDGRKKYYVSLPLYSITPYEHSKDILFSADILIPNADKKNITIFRLVRSDDNSIGHAVLFAGCLLTKTSGGVFKSCKYYIMDCNYIQSYKAVNIDKNRYDGKAGFIYTSNSGKAYIWNDSMHNQ